MELRSHKPSTCASIPVQIGCRLFESRGTSLGSDDGDYPEPIALLSPSYRFGSQTHYKLGNCSFLYPFFKSILYYFVHALDVRKIDFQKHEDNKGMPDIVLGAILAIAGAAVGSGITAFFSYKSAKLQVRANYTNLQLQLEDQAKEARRARLIEVRKTYLLPISHTISNWVESTIQETNMSVRREESRRKAEVDPENSALVLEEAMDKAQEWTSKVTRLRGQISDKTLENLIVKAVTVTSEVNTARMPILRLLNNAKDIDKDPLIKVSEEERRLVGLLHDHLLQVNKRIEELLSGDESQ